MVGGLAGGALRLTGTEQARPLWLFGEAKKGVKPRNRKSVRRTSYIRALSVLGPGVYRWYELVGLQNVRSTSLL